MPLGGLLPYNTAGDDGPFNLLSPGNDAIVTAMDRGEDPAPTAAPFSPAGRDWGAVLRMAIPAALVAIGSKLGPQQTAAALGGLMRGVDRRRLDTERAQEQQARRARDGADFTARALQQLGAMDPEQHQAFADYVAEIGGSVYGLDPQALRSTLGQMSGALVPAHDRREAATLLERLDTKYPGKWYSTAFKGRTVSRDELAFMAGEQAIGEDGQPLAPKADRSFLNLGLRGVFDQSSGAIVPGTTPPEEEPELPNELRARAAELRTRIRAAKNRKDEAAAADLQARYDDIVAAQRDVGMADDRPRMAAGDRGPTDAQSFSMSERLANAWAKTTGPVREMDRQLRIMDTGLRRFRSGDTNGGSQAVLVTFQKILDPTSVVRESEYARTTDGQSLLNRLEGYVERLRVGGATLTDEEMAAMVQTAREMYESMSGWSAGTRRRIEAQAKRFQLDPATIFDDALTGSEPAAAASPSGGSDGWTEVAPGVRMRAK